MSVITGTVPIGTIVAWTADPLSKPIPGWKRCDGTRLNLEEYNELYQVIKTAFGGDPQKGYFNLPDLRGRFLRGVDDGQGRDPDARSRVSSAQGGNTGDSIGSLQGDALKIHSHQWNGWYNTSHHESGRECQSRDGLGDPNFQATLESGESSESRPKNVYVQFIIFAGRD